MAVVIPQFNSIRMEIEDGILLISQPNGARDEDHELVDDVIEVPLVFLSEFLECIRVTKIEKV
jgi:hypothetical protein